MQLTDDEKKLVKIRKLLKDNGWVESETNYTNANYLKKGKLYLRQRAGGPIQLGVIETFDRWANSIDFEFEVPKLEKTLLRKLDTAAKRADDNQFHRPYGKRIRL